MTNSHAFARPARINHQSGVAAIEFALVFSLLILVLYSIATFGAALYTQQVVTRAAEDGARAISLLPPSDPLVDDDARIQGVIFNSLNTSVIAPTVSRSWIEQKVKVRITKQPGSATGIPPAQATIDVNFPYDSVSKLLPSLPLIGSSPEKLTSRAIAALQSS